MCGFFHVGQVNRAVWATGGAHRDEDDVGIGHISRITRDFESIRPKGGSQKFGEARFMNRGMSLLDQGALLRVDFDSGRTKAAGCEGHSGAETYVPESDKGHPIRFFGHVTISKKGWDALARGANPRARRVSAIHVQQPASHLHLLARPRKS